MLRADLDLAARFLLAAPPPGRVLCCAVSGAHMYGFPSPDSDLDLKGIYLASTRDMLGLRGRTDPHDLTEWFEGVECDLTLNEAGQALTLLLAGNGNMLERILSPLQVAPEPQLADLQRLARGAISKRFAKHYAGFFRGCRRELEREPTVKGLLYAYRVALTGVHLLSTGVLDADLLSLAPKYPIADFAALVAAKAAGPEHGAFARRDLDAHLPILADLEDRLRAAESTSTLPEGAENAVEIDHWLTDRRVEDLRRA